MEGGGGGCRAPLPSAVAHPLDPATTPEAEGFSGAALGPGGQRGRPIRIDPQPPLKAVWGGPEGGGGAPVGILDLDLGADLKAHRTPEGEGLDGQIGRPASGGVPGGGGEGEAPPGSWGCGPGGLLTPAPPPTPLRLRGRERGPCSSAKAPR